MTIFSDVHVMDDPIFNTLSKFSRANKETYKNAAIDIAAISVLEVSEIKTDKS